MTTADIRRGALNLRASAGLTETVTVTWTDDNGDPITDITDSSLWLGGTTTDQDDFTGATEITGTKDGATFTFTVPIPDDNDDTTRLRMTADGQLATVGRLFPSEIGSTTLDQTVVRLGGAEVTIQTVGPGGPGPGGGGVDFRASVALAAVATDGTAETIEILNPLDLDEPGVPVPVAAVTLDTLVLVVSGPNAGVWTIPGAGGAWTPADPQPLGRQSVAVGLLGTLDTVTLFGVNTDGSGGGVSLDHPATSFARVPWATTDDLAGKADASAVTAIGETASAAAQTAGEAAEAANAASETAGNAANAASSAQSTADDALALAEAAEPQARRSIASLDPIRLIDAGLDPVATWDTADWDDYAIREHDGPVYDPITNIWICCYSAQSASLGGATRVAARISDDGETWTGHPDNPIATDLEDPYLARNVDGTLYRDSSGRALMYGEEKDGSTHRGVDLWRSDPNTLDGWAKVGRVLDRGDEAAWDETDRTSPTVVHVDGLLYMLYEGRSLPAQEGKTGLAISSDQDGTSFTAEPDPIIDDAVPDDIRRIGGGWVMLCHDPDGSVASRYATSRDPDEWDPSSFAPLPGNPFDHLGATTVMVYGNDPETVLYDVPGTELRIGRVRSAPANVTLDTPAPP